MQGTVLQDDSQAIGVLSPFERIAGTRAITLPEILDTILGYATPPTLASAARVSRAWWTIALDKLWSGRDVRVIDLLRVLPLDVEEVVNASPASRFWSLQRNPTKDEWTRFGSYTSRVRSLIIPAYGPDRFDPRITEWEVDKDVLFPRLRKIEAHLLGPYATSPPQLRSFITPGLRELFLDTDNMDERSSGLVVQSLLDDLATIEGLHLQKFKFNQSGGIPNTTLAVGISNLAAANEGSIEALELSSSHLNVLFITGHSLLNLRALSFGVRLLAGGGDRRPIQVLVEGCPNVAYLRIQLERVHPPTNILDLPGLRIILAWDLLSFEVQRKGGVDFTKANLEEMAKAWPKLKKLNLNWNAGGTRIYHPFSLLADMVSAFPQLEELGALFYYRTQEENLLPTYRLPSEQRPPSRLERLRLGCYDFPESQSKRDSIAQFLARVLPPGLRIDRGPRDIPEEDPVQLAEEKAAVTGRDIDPGWDALFRKIEELHGGVRIWVGSLPKDSDSVWF